MRALPLTLRMRQAPPGVKHALHLAASGTAGSAPAIESAQWAGEMPQRGPASGHGPPPQPSRGRIRPHVCLLLDNALPKPLGHAKRGPRILFEDPLRVCLAVFYGIPLACRLLLRWLHRPVLQRRRWKAPGVRAWHRSIPGCLRSGLPLGRIQPSSAFLYTGCQIGSEAHPIALLFFAAHYAGRLLRRLRLPLDRIFITRFGNRSFIVLRLSRSSSQ